MACLSTTEPPPLAQGHPRRGLILAIMCLCLVLVVVSVSSVNVALPSIVGDLGASQTEQLWIIDSYALVFACLLLPMGAAGDRWGRKGALLVGLAIFAACSLLAAWADSPSQLIAYRGMMGVGAALIMPATLSIITVAFPPGERSKAIATWAGFAGAGGAIGPIASGGLLQTFWWGSIFFVSIPIIVVIVAATVLVVPTSRDDEGRPLDLVGAALSIVGLGALVFGIIEGPEKGWSNSLVLGAFVVAVVGLALFVAFELRARHPMLDPRLFRIKGFAAGAVTITLAFMVMFGFFLLLTLYLQFVKGYSPLRAGVATLPFALAMMAVAPRSPLVVKRLGLGTTITVGQTFQVIGFVGLAFVRPETDYWVLVPLIVLMAAGMALMMPPSTESIVSSLPPQKAGVGSAVNDTTREVGGAIGIALLGSLAATGYRSSLGAAADSLPPESRELARDSIGGAVRVAEMTGGDGAARLLAAARPAYVDGLRVSFLVAAGLCVVSAATVRWLRTGGAEPVGEDRAVWAGTRTAAR